MFNRNLYFVLAFVFSSFNLVSQDIQKDSESIIDISERLTTEERSSFEKIITSLMDNIKAVLEKEFSDFEKMEEGKELEKILEKLQLVMFYRLNLSFAKDDILRISPSKIGSDEELTDLNAMSAV